MRNDKTDNPPVWWQYLHSMSYIWIVVIIIYIHPAYILIKYKLILFLNNLNCFCFCFCFCFALTLLCLLIIVSYLLVFLSLSFFLSFFPLFCFIYFINSIKNKIISFLFFSSLVSSYVLWSYSLLSNLLFSYIVLFCLFNLFHLIKSASAGTRTRISTLEGWNSALRPQMLTLNNKGKHRLSPLECLALWWFKWK